MQCNFLMKAIAVGVDWFTAPLPIPLVAGSSYDRLHRLLLDEIIILTEETEL